LLLGQIELNNDNIINPKNDAYKAIKDLSMMQKEYLDQIAKIQMNKQLETFFTNLQIEVKKELNKKTDQIILIASDVENTFSNYSKIIESRIPKYSKRRIIILSVLFTVILFSTALYFLNPQLFQNLMNSFKSNIS
jgi:hypothetical protein